MPKLKGKAKQTLEQTHQELMVALAEERGAFEDGNRTQRLDILQKALEKKEWATMLKTMDLMLESEEL